MEYVQPCPYFTIAKKIPYIILLCDVTAFYIKVWIKVRLSFAVKLINSPSGSSILPLFFGQLAAKMLSL